MVLVVEQAAASAWQVIVCVAAAGHLHPTPHVLTCGGHADTQPLPAAPTRNPLQEVERGDDDICEVDMHNSCVLVNEMKLKVDLTKYAERHQFNFDEALDEYVSNDQVRACACLCVRGFKHWSTAVCWDVCGAMAGWLNTRWPMQSCLWVANCVCLHMPPLPLPLLPVNRCTA